MLQNKTYTDALQDGDLKEYHNLASAIEKDVITASLQSSMCVQNVGWGEAVSCPQYKHSFLHVFDEETRVPQSKIG